MRALVPLIALALAGCGDFLEDRFPRERHVYDVDGKNIEIATQYDPIEFAWFSRATSTEIAFGLTPEDRDTVVELIETEIGAIYCDNKRMEVAEFNKDNLPGGGNVVYLASLGSYQVVSRCAWNIPDGFPETPKLPRAEDLPKADDLPDRPDWLGFLNDT